MVLRAVKSLGIPDVNINERNDICVGEFKMSTAGLREESTDNGGGYTRLRLCV